MPASVPQTKLLVVDDDAGLLRLIEKTLRREGLQVATASTGRDAINWLTQNSVDLMLLDLKLQDIEAKELVGRLEQIGRTVPFIIITGQGDERVAVDMMKRGALDYLVKDVRFIEFVPTVVKRALHQLEKDQRLTFAEERANLALTLVQEGFSSILVIGPDVPDPTIVYVNPAFSRLTGVHASDVMGERLSLLEARTGPWKELRQVIESQERFVGELTTRRANGELRITDCQVCPVIGKTGQLKHWAVIQHDITHSKELEKEILEVSDQEQRRIGRDLHDGLGQHLTGLEFLSQVLVGKLKSAAPELVEPAQNISRQIRETITQTRLLSHNLSPVPLEAEGLMVALGELAAGTKAMSNVHCEFICIHPAAVEDPDVATHAYRIAQEAVNNALKHSQAKNILIKLNSHDHEWTMSIEDDGVGLHAESNESRGLGLRMMLYRAQMIGASLEIKSIPEGGVHITCAFPKHL